MKITRGLIFISIGLIFLSISLYLSSKDNFLTSSSAPFDPKMVYFILGMIVSTIFVMIKYKPSKKSLILPQPFSTNDYEDLIKTVNGLWFLMKKNKRLYLGIIIICWSFDKLGMLYKSSFLHNPFIISFTYLLAFSTYAYILLNERQLEKQIITASVEGFKLENKMRISGFFNDFFQKNKNIKISSIFLFHLIFPLWLLYRSLDITATLNFIPTSLIISGMLIISVLASMLLWHFRCVPILSLYKKMNKLQETGQL